MQMSRDEQYIHLIWRKVKCRGFRETGGPEDDSFDVFWPVIGQISAVMNHRKRLHVWMYIVVQILRDAVIAKIVVDRAVAMEICPWGNP